MDVVELDGSQLETANRRYAQLHFEPSRPGTDRTFAMLDDDGAPLALGRLQDRSGHLELGGFWVDEASRGRGLARALVSHVLAHLEPGQVAWCIPFEHLAPFYSSFGMRPASAKEAPPAIRGKLDFCATQRAAGRYARGTRLLRYERPPTASER